MDEKESTGKLQNWNCAKECYYKNSNSFLTTKLWHKVTKIEGLASTIDENDLFLYANTENLW
jgi:hypothetical protein